MQTTILKQLLFKTNYIQKHPKNKRFFFSFRHSIGTFFLHSAKILVVIRYFSMN